MSNSQLAFSRLLCTVFAIRMMHLGVRMDYPRTMVKPIGSITKV